VSSVIEQAGCRRRLSSAVALALTTPWATARIALVVARTSGRRGPVDVLEVLRRTEGELRTASRHLALLAFNRVERAFRQEVELERLRHVESRA